MRQRSSRAASALPANPEILLARRERRRLERLARRKARRGSTATRSLLDRAELLNDLRHDLRVAEEAFVDRVLSLPATERSSADACEAASRLEALRASLETAANRLTADMAAQITRVHRETANALVSAFVCKAMPSCAMTARRTARGRTRRRPRSVRHRRAGNDEPAPGDPDPDSEPQRPRALGGAR
jgi:hypothetical protein